MRKLLASIAALSLSVTPALADPEIKEWKTPHSVGCMLLRECTDEVYEIKTVEDLLTHYPDIDLSYIGEEMDQMIRELNRIGVGVYLASGKYFPPRHRGVYHTVGNNFFLNIDYMYDPEVILSVTRHEGWHAVQDCMAGSIDNNNIAIIWNDGVVPRSFTIRASAAYSMMPKAIPWESEAFWAAETPYQTVEALKACKADKPMWEIYDPTPLTHEWLEENGYIK